MRGEGEGKVARGEGGRGKEACGKGGGDTFTINPVPSITWKAAARPMCSVIRASGKL